jgi:hypothetical protein
MKNGCGMETGLNRWTAFVAAIALWAFSGCATHGPDAEVTLQSQQRELQQTQKQLADVQEALAALSKESQALKTQLTRAEAELTQLKASLRPPPALNTAWLPAAESVEPGADGSVEAQLLSQGQTWKRIAGPIVPGAYVEDTLKGRLNQPKGRGRIGKVMAANADAATVDFGRGWQAGIFLRELRPVRIEPAPKF